MSPKSTIKVRVDLSLICRPSCSPTNVLLKQRAHFFLCSSRAAGHYVEITLEPVGAGSLCTTKTNYETGYEDYVTMKIA